MCLTWHKHKVEPFILFYQRIHQTNTVRRMHIVVHIAMNNQQFIVEVFGKFPSRWHLNFKSDICDLSFLLLNLIFLCVVLFDFFFLCFVLLCLPLLVKNRIQRIQSDINHPLFLGSRGLA